MNKLYHSLVQFFMLKINVCCHGYHAHRRTINQISLFITVIFLLNIAGTLFIMVQYNAEMCVVSGFAWKLGFSQTHGPIKLINYLYTSKNGTSERLQRSVFVPSKLEVEVSKQIYI